MNEGNLLFLICELILTVLIVLFLFNVFTPADQLSVHVASAGARITTAVEILNQFESGWIELSPELEQDVKVEIFENRIRTQNPEKLTFYTYPLVHRGFSYEGKFKATVGIAKGTEFGVDTTKPRYAQSCDDYAFPGWSATGEYEEFFNSPTVINIVGDQGDKEITINTHQGDDKAIVYGACAIGDALGRAGIPTIVVENSMYDSKIELYLENSDTISVIAQKLGEIND